MERMEFLLDLISKECKVIEEPLPKGFDGLYYKGRIFIRKGLDFIRKKEILAEEYGHHLTSFGDILDYSDPQSYKQEMRARRIGYELTVTLEDLIFYYYDGITDYEMAETIGVSVQQLRNALHHYRLKFGNQFNVHGFDFDFTLGTLTITPNEAEKQIRLNIFADAM